MDNLVNITSRVRMRVEAARQNNKKPRIVAALLALAKDSRPPGCLKVKTSERLWRIRVGDWRVGYEIDDASQTVTIVTIGHRREFYP